jgi:hypothetical protein
MCPGVHAPVYGAALRCNAGGTGRCWSGASWARGNMSRASSQTLRRTARDWIPPRSMAMISVTDTRLQNATGRGTRSALRFTVELSRLDIRRAILLTHC